MDSIGILHFNKSLLKRVVPLFVLISEASHHCLIYSHQGKVFAVRVEQRAVSFSFHMDFLLLIMDLFDALLCMKYLCTVVFEMVHEFFV